MVTTTVQTGPTVLEEGQTALPYYQTQVQSGYQVGNQFYVNYADIPLADRSRAISSSRTTTVPTGYYNVQSVRGAAKTLYQAEPGEPVQSTAPGASSFLRTIEAGYLPDIGPTGEQYTPAYLGGPKTGNGIPSAIWIPAASLGIAFVTLLIALRR